MEKKVGILKKWFAGIDFGMVVITISLLCIGLVMVASASSYHALFYYDDSNYFFNRQLIFAVAGLIAMFGIATFDYRKLKKWSYIAFIFSAILLLLVITPLGVTRNGAKRWLGFGSFQLQPSEIMKPVLVLAIATYLSKNISKLKNVKTYIIPAVFILLVILLMYLQKHMSGMLVLVIGGISVIFFSGIKLKKRFIILGCILVVAAAFGFVYAEPFRLQRIFSFMNPEQDLQGGNWQAAQSLYAIGSGGLFGRGLGQSRQKYLWLPEAQNDFIFSVLGEELGFIGTITVLGLFAYFIFKGYKTAITCKDLFGSLVAAGITTIFATQIIVNIAVVTCSMPVTGMPLPFFSYGGTSLFINLCSMGIVLSISKNCEKM